MNWDMAIERNRGALKRILAALVAMAGLGADFTSPLWGGRRSTDRRVGVRAASTSPTLPRHLHRAVLRLLRPAEAAARRLVIVAARGLVVELPRARAPRPDVKAAHAALRGLGLAVVLTDAGIADAARCAAAKRAAARRDEQGRRPLVLPLFDPLRNPLRGRGRTVPPYSAPRILSFHGAAPHRLPPPPSSHDPIDATRLAMRLAALAAALDDLPGHARRFARWKSRNAAAVRNRGTRIRRIWPLRPGRAYGIRKPGSSRPAHEVDQILSDMHHFAWEVLTTPDTS